MGNLDIKNLMKILSNMDKKDLEKGINQAKQILNQKNADDILDNLQKGKD